MSQVAFNITLEQDAGAGVATATRTNIKTLAADAYDEGGRFRIVFATAGVQASKTPEAFETDETCTDGLRRAIEAKVRAFYEEPHAVVRVELQPKG